MRTRLAIILLVATASLPVVLMGASAQQLPNAVDLRAAYCLQVSQHNVGQLIGPPVDGEMPEATKQVLANTLEKARSNVRRLQLYLVPRIPQLDAFAISAATKSGDEDSALADRDLAQCYSTCQIADCFNKCSANSAAVAKVRGCNDLSFLPF